MANDLEDDWALLGQPSRIERTAKKTRAWTMTFLEFIFTWIGHAWSKVCATIRSIWTLLWAEDFITKIAIIVVVGGILTFLTQFIRADGHLDYCRINQTAYAAPAVKDTPARPDEFTLSGHRNWRPDSDYMYKAEHKEDVLAWARALNCPVR